MSHRLRRIGGLFLVVVGEGDAKEEATWEWAMLASHHSLENLTCLIDQNHSNDQALIADSRADKCASFGWLAVEIVGHNHGHLRVAFSTRSDRPTAVVANAVKGKGILAMESKLACHRGAPSAKELTDFLESMG